MANLSTQKILAQIPKRSRFIDQACGTGVLTLKIGQRFPKSRIVGVDLHDAYLSIARQKAAALNVTNIEFIVGRAEGIVLERDVDCITSSYLAKYADLDLLIGNAKEMLRERGVLVIHELTYPRHPVFVSLWKLQFKFLQTFGPWLYPEWEIAFQELPSVVKVSGWLNEVKDALKEKGFSSIRDESLAFQSSAIVTAVK